jgi:hypothetical protein
VNVPSSLSTHTAEFLQGFPSHTVTGCIDKITIINNCMLALYGGIRFSVQLQSKLSSDGMFSAVI